MMNEDLPALRIYIWHMESIQTHTEQTTHLGNDVNMRDTLSQEYKNFHGLKIKRGVNEPFLGAFAKLRKATISIVTSVRPSFRMK